MPLLLSSQFITVFKESSLAPRAVLKSCGGVQACLDAEG